MTEMTTHLQKLRQIIQAKDVYPIGILAYFGPDDQTVTKIVGVVAPSENAEPISKTWRGSHVSLDPQVAGEIGKFFQNHRVQDVVMTDGVVGCPHDEGVDYPLGESCPHCPFWD